VCAKTYGYIDQFYQLVSNIDQVISEKDAAVRKKLKLIDQVYKVK